MPFEALYPVRPYQMEPCSHWYHASGTMYPRQSPVSPAQRRRGHTLKRTTGGHHCAPQPSRYTIPQQTDDPTPLHGSTQEGPPPLLRHHLPSRTLPSEKKERNRHFCKGYCKLELRRKPAAPAEKGQNFVTIARRRKKERPEGPAGNDDWARRGIAEGHRVTMLSFRTSSSAL